MNNMRYFRKKKNLTLQNISDKTSLAIGYICDLEKEKRTNPSKDVMSRIALALEETVQAVFFANLDDPVTKTKSDE